MRKILAGFMAAAMLTSICATASMAETRTSATADATLSGTLQTTAFSAKSLSVSVTENGKTSVYNQPFNASYEIVAPATNVALADVAKSLNGVTVKDIEIDKKRYSVELKQDITTPAMVHATVLPAAKISDTTVVVKILDADGKALQTSTPADHSISFAYTAANGNVGTGGLTADIEAEGDLTKLNIADIIECDGQGNPIPLTETQVGVDKDQNGQQGVQSNNTLYFIIKKGMYDFNNDSYWKVKVSKGNNAKLVKSVSDTSKNFSKNLYNAVSGGEVSGTAGRQRVIKVELNELHTDEEFKVALDMTLTAQSGAERVFGIKQDSKLKVNDFNFYVKNIVKNADNDWSVGVNGLMLNPLANDWNDVTYYDEDGDVAFMRFFGDSDVGKFYAKLSTKWTHDDYAAYFNDQDAYYFEFTGSPKMSATSRADLQIYNPFVDVDGNETIDPSTATIYQIVDGDLIDVTDSFTYGEGENGENAFITRTRFLGSYIICEKPVAEAAGEGDIDDLMPDENEIPVAPDTTTGGKGPANTGRYA